MPVFRTLVKQLNPQRLLGVNSWRTQQCAGIKYFPPPIDYSGIEYPENRKLRFVEKAPQYPPTMRPPKMMKRLILMRGPEEVHTDLLHKQYGIIAITGGRLRWEHFDMIRTSINRNLDVQKMFAIWRVDPPWQPVTRKGQGQRMGGGKGAINHYVSPLKAGRVILELGGQLEWMEARQMLVGVAGKLPFKAEVVSQKIMEKKAEKKRRIAEENLNPYTMKYVIQNNMGGCRNWLSPYDFKWYGEHL